MFSFPFFPSLPPPPPAVAGECSSLITAALIRVVLDGPPSEFDHPLLIRRTYFEARGDAGKRVNACKWCTCIRRRRRKKKKPDSQQTPAVAGSCRPTTRFLALNSDCMLCSEEDNTCTSLGFYTWRLHSPSTVAHTSTPPSRGTGGYRSTVFSSLVEEEESVEL